MGWLLGPKAALDGGAHPETPILLFVPYCYIIRGIEVYCGQLIRHREWRWEHWVGPGVAVFPP